MLSLDFYSKENNGFRVVPVHPGLVTSIFGVHEVGVTVESSMSCESWVYGYDTEPVMFLTLKIHESTKHYLTQMLLATN